MLLLYSAKGKNKQSQLPEILSTQAQRLQTQHVHILRLQQDTAPHHTATQKRHRRAPRHLKSIHSKHKGEDTLIEMMHTNGRPGYWDVRS